ncbi:MAG: 50S ribosomal protein L11 methyltransferase [Planctomycetota bacterium]|nr:50S ribosomal protein L11 methyltransferase [Planctomycetota bacterium]
MPQIPSLIPNATLRELVLPFARQPIELLVVKDPWATLAANKDDPQHDVYWGELWPSGVALADAVLDGTIPLPDGPEPILEVGCGTGLVSIATAIAGAAGMSVLMTDREPRALLLGQENAQRNGVAERVRGMRLDWSQKYDGQHRLIFAADCLYLTDAGWRLAVFLRRALSRAPGARAVLVDPDRLTARNFSYVAREAGFQVRMFQRRVPFMVAHGPVRELHRQDPHAAIREPLEATFYELTIA